MARRVLAAVAQRLTVSWIAAYNQQDSKALAGLYHQDAIVSTMQEGSFEGPAAMGMRDGSDWRIHREMWLR